MFATVESFVFWYVAAMLSQRNFFVAVDLKSYRFVVLSAGTIMFYEDFSDTMSFTKGFSKLLVTLRYLKLRIISYRSFSKSLLDCGVLLLLNPLLLRGSFILV